MNSNKSACCDPETAVTLLSTLVNYFSAHISRLTVCPQASRHSYPDLQPPEGCDSEYSIYLEVSGDSRAVATVLYSYMISLGYTVRKLCHIQFKVSKYINNNRRFIKLTLIPEQDQGEDLEDLKGKYSDPELEFDAIEEKQNKN